MTQKLECARLGEQFAIIPTHHNFDWCRFLLIVLSAYKEMQSQENTAILSDMDACSFEDAFKLFTPGK
jgi:hypothetical protein